MQIGDALESAISEILKNTGVQGLEALLRRAVSTAAAASSDTASSTDSRTQVLQEILQALNCNEDSIRCLKEAIAGSENGKAALAELLKKLQVEMPQSAGKDVPVIDEETLCSPERLAEVLSKAKTLDAKVFLDAAKQLSAETQTEVQSSENSVENVSAIAGKLVDIVEIRQGENPQAGRVENPLQRLCEVLRSLPKASEALLAQGERVIEAVLRGHLDTVKAIEQELRVAVEPAFSDNPMQTLLNTVERAVKAVPEPKSEIEETYVRFVSNLRAEIKNIIDGESTAGQEMRALLEKALQSIEKEIKPMFGARLSDVQVKDRDSLPRQAIVLLRSIEAQVSTLINMSDEDLQLLAKQMQGDSRSKLPEAIKNIETLFQELRRVPLPGTGNNIEAFQKQIDVLQANFMNLLKEQMQPEKLRALLNDFLVEIKALPASLQMLALDDGKKAGLQLPPFVQNLRDVEGTIKELLQIAANNGQAEVPELLKEPAFQQLMKQIGEILRLELPDDGVVEQLNVRRFVLSLSQKMMNAVQPGAPSSALKETLEAALKEVQQLIGRQTAAPYESATPAENSIHPSVMQPVRPAPEEPVSQQGAKQILVEHLRYLEKQIRETIKLIDASAAGELKSAAPEASVLIGKLPLDAADSVVQQERLSREISSYREQEILQQLRPGQQQYERQEQRSLLLKDPAIIVLLKGLKNLDLSLLNAGNAAEKQFVDFLKELAQKIPPKDTAAAKETLSRREIEDNLAKLDKQFRAEQLQPVNPKDLQLKTMVAALEQAMKGQELLDRLNTVMNVLGEPAMFLFPSIIHGFASQLELIGYPMAPGDEIENDEKQGEKKENKGKYKRFEFNMSFAGLGRIQSRVMFREGEFLLDLCAESEAVAAFLEARFSKFEALLHSNGYGKTELRVSVAPFAELTPSWVPALLGADRSSWVAE